MSVLRPEVVADGFGFLEGPRWHEGCLWFSDFSTRRVHRLDGSGTAETVAVVPGRPSGLGFRPDGSVLVVSMETRELLRIEPDTGAVHLVADLSDHLAGIGNDMLVDAHGRAYVGGMGFDLFRGDQPSPGNIVMIDESDTVQVVAEDLLVPNGTVIDSTGRMIVAETNRSQLTSFSIDASGSLADRTLYAALDDVAPDGICIDAADGIWVGAVFSEQFVYVDREGRVAQRVPIPGRWAVACALGGDDGRDLYLLTAETTMRQMRHDQANARVEVVRVDIPGAGR